MTITKDEIVAAVAGREHIHRLCFRHPDIRHRAGYQSYFVRHARGERGDLTPTEAHARATPAGAKIPLTESALIPIGCGPGGCKPRGPFQFLDEDQE